MNSACTVVFTPAGKRVNAFAGQTLFDIARQGGIEIDSACGGRGICGRCRVVPLQPEALAALTDAEQRYASKRNLPAGHRLSCCAVVQQPLTCDVPLESLVHKPLVRKRPDERVVDIDPVVRAYWLTLPAPQMDDQVGEWQRLVDELQAQQATIAPPSAWLLRQLPQVLQRGKRDITAVVNKQGQVTALYPHFVEQLYGIAIDMGSTTIAAQLCDMRTGDIVADAGMVNPQIRFGEDLMSRVSYAQMNPQGTAQMQQAMAQTLDELVQQVAQQANIDMAHIVYVVVVGNPVMHHIALGIDPSPLGVAPFAPATTDNITVCASDMGISVLPAYTPVYWPPLFAGHVGADAAAVLLAQAPYAQESNILLVDVGTNAEIILGNRHGLWAASSPTGPALEGAQITHGQRAAIGAIERVRIDPSTGQARIKVIGCDIWSDDPLFAQQSPSVTGICGSGIIEVLVEMFAAGIMRADGRIIAHPATQPDKRTFSYRLYNDIVITQTDVRAVQLAKAALYAGCQLLLEQANIDAPDAVVLAGAFGSHIDPYYAQRLGLIPECAQVSSAGNAAGTGARMLLLNHSARQVLAEQVRRARKIETALEPRFQDIFVAAMAMPQ